MPFSGDYVLRYIRPGEWTYHPATAAPLTYTRPNGEQIILDDMQLVTDKGSVPRFLWCIPGFAPSDLERPSLVHDAIFERRHDGNDEYSFTEANQILYEALIDEGYPMWKARLLRWGCNWFGVRIWDAKK